MTISFSSFISSSLAIALLVCFLLLVMKQTKTISNFGIGCIYFLVLLILFRGFIPIDFYSLDLTKSIYSYRILPWLKDLVNTTLFTVNSISITPWKILLLIWIIGFLFFIYKPIYGYFLSRKYLNTLPDITDAQIQESFQNAMNSIFTKKHPFIKLVVSTEFTTPAVFGIIKPVIILPSFDYTKEELYYIFMHEMLHYKHKDFLIKFLSDLLIAIHWWNPIISKLLFPVLNQIQELFVDYHLTQTFDSEQKASYMSTITKTLRYNQKHNSKKISMHPQTYALADNHSKSVIIQRLQYIINHPVKQISVYGISFCIILFVLSFTIVFEPSYQIHSEYGKQLYKDNGEHTYYIQNGDNYDFYMDNEYVYTTSEILETFKDVPIYHNKEEVPQK